MCVCVCVCVFVCVCKTQRERECVRARLLMCPGGHGCIRVLVCPHVRGAGIAQWLNAGLVIERLQV